MAEFVRNEKIPDVILVKPRVFGDDRGFFLETYNKKEYTENGIDMDCVQSNHSKSILGVLRGIHFQKGDFAQGKLVRATTGLIYDVAVDLRKNSPTFGMYVGYELSEDNHYMLYLPIGFGHGFLTLSKEANFEYMVSGGNYNKASEGAVRWNDSTINIEWPFKEYNIPEPILSEKDKINPLLADIPDEDLF